MKPKRTWLIFAIIFVLLGMLFFLSSILFFIDLDKPGFTDNLCYTEGIIKEINSGKNDDGNVFAYSIPLEENSVLTIDKDSIENEVALNNLKKGDKVIFAFSANQEHLEDEGPTFITPAFLSHDNQTIISIESYENSIRKNIKISVFIALISAIIFCFVGIIFYFQWFRQRKIYNKGNLI